MTWRVETTPDVATCLALRRDVFILEQSVSEADELDDLDDMSLHLIAWDGGTPVGTARLTMMEGTAKIGRVCVLGSHRGQGLGAALIVEALAVARGENARNAKLGAQIHALGFYERFGFRATGPIYDDAGISHRDMVCDL